jgi:hypothetical protein
MLAGMYNEPIAKAIAGPEPSRYDCIMTTSAGSPPPTGGLAQEETPDKHQKDAVTARQVGWIGAAATVVAALLALLAGVISGSISASSENDRFLKTQRQASYAKFLTEIQTIGIVEGRILTACRSKQSISRAELVNQIKVYDIAYQSLLVAFTNVQLVASEATEKPASKLFDLHLGRNAKLDGMVYWGKPQNEYACKPVLDFITSDFQGEAGEEQTFRQSARKDLGY